MVITLHGGIGPPDSLAWIERIYVEAAANERISGRGNGSATARRKQLFFATLQAISARSSTVILVLSARRNNERAPQGIVAHAPIADDESDNDSPIHVMAIAHIT